MSLPLLRGTLDVMILKAASWGEVHGYAVSRWIRETTGGTFEVQEGALYPALRRLEGRGWLQSRWTTTGTGREARVYELTDSGRRELKREVSTWVRYVDAMTRVLEAVKPEAM
ncbi:MAG: PadR family transcriptional regulator [Gemmatimonadetes bacterium]|nr:PadR family transcriptional regulator [Gemmatimonadota bacterium]